MNRSMLMSALFLTACATPDPVLVVPAELTRPVVVACPEGDTSRALGQCAILLRQGLNTANSKLSEIGEIVAGVR